MVMPQRDDPPSRCALRRTGTIEAIKRRAAAEKKDAEEKKKAEARARAAYRRKQRKFEENGLLEGFAQINWSFMAARDELKRRGFSLELMNELKRDVVARISPWNKCITPTTWSTSSTSITFRAARCRSKRFPPTSRNRRGKNGRKSCARSSAASRGCDRMQ